MIASGESSSREHAGRSTAGRHCGEVRSRIPTVTVASVTTTPLYEYDVAFSFLFRDLPVAKELSERLSGLRVFVFDRYKEELLGGDGMEKFGEIFSKKGRLSVILYRDGWGDTPWTAFEESHIKSRALETRMTSFMIVRLDEAATLRKWMPTYHLFASENDTRDEQAAIIRARSRELGAIVRTLSPSEKALERIRAENAARSREERMHSAHARSEIDEELRTLFSQLVNAANEINAAQPTLQLKAGHTDTACVISDRRSVSLYLQPVGNTLRERVLRVNWWNAPHELPNVRTPPYSGNRHAGADIYKPIVSEEDEWVWEWDPKFEQQPGFRSFLPTYVYRTPQLVDAIIEKLMERIFDR